jgi:glycosyltransferase involved in cell wall biosynthesis
VTGDSPLVSVVIPTHDRPELGRAAIDSVRAQTYGDVDLWVVDDASEEPFTLSEDQHRDPRVNLLRLSEVQGGAGARNEGIVRCRGPLIAFLDDDDEWLPDKLERQVPALLTAPASAGAVECGYEMLRDGRLEFRYVPLPKPNLIRGLLERPMLCPSTMLIRREVFDAVGMFDASLERVHDWELWLRFADRFSVVSVPDVLVLRRHNEFPLREAAAWTRSVYDSLRPRVERLPVRQRRRVLAWHSYDVGMQLVRSGSVSEGAHAILEAWRLRPASVRYLASALAARLGPRAVGALSRLTASSRRVLRRARGRDPYVRRW